MLVTKHSFRLRGRSKAKQRTVLTQPNQSMTIKAILERFVKGLPMGVVEHEPHYIDQKEGEEIDFEKAKRLDFADKIAFGQQLADQKRQAMEEAKEAERAARAEAKRKKEAALESQKASNPEPKKE